jgi:lysosomal acid lipase/cholesteryl ester hydrolase
LELYVSKSLEKIGLVVGQHGTDEFHFRLIRWDEMGIYDVPSVIEEILKVTGHPKLMYIGHSMGTTQYFVAMSQFPQLNKYIKLAVLYAPVAFLNNTKLFLRNLAPKADQIRVDPFIQCP